MRKIIVLIIILCGAFVANSQSQSAAYLGYIDEYKTVAVRHHQQYGIPASITLAQGLLESSAGQSRLATDGNNHFGIKCHKDWTGDGIYHDDDELQECFRKYNNASESYEDHARFLKRARYKPLFELEPTDYKGWAKTLRKCGYATDPRYPEKLISIIELYELYTYDSGQPTIATPIQLEGDETLEHSIDAAIYEEIRMTHNIRRRGGLHYVIAHEDDKIEAIAAEFGIRAKRLRSFNDIKDEEVILEKGDIVYIEEKGDTAITGASIYVTVKGDNLYTLSQQFGIRLESLCRLNNISSPMQDIRPGTELKLR